MAIGILAVLDDIAALMDDVAVMGKVAAKKTAGVLGDDLAVNAEKATGFHASRELPVLWAITKGSFLNKLIILPAAFLLSAYAPWLIVPILLLGGAYLSYEGVEKIYGMLFPHKAHAEVAEETAEAKSLAEREAQKVKAAIRTDFILSIEIIVIALGTVMEESLALQLFVVTLIAVLATVGVYGLVAMLVRMDDAGLALIERAKAFEGASARYLEKTGRLLIASLPRVIRLLGYVGTVAMLLVGGGMFVHNIEMVHHLLGFMPIVAAELAAGLAVGALLLGAKRLFDGA